MMVQGDRYDRSELPVYVLLDIDYVMGILNKETKGDRAQIMDTRFTGYGEWVVDIFIKDECLYPWLVDRSDFGKGMPALFPAMGWDN